MRLDVPIDPGALDRRVTIQYRSDETSESGFPTEDWTTTHAIIVPMCNEGLSGVERVQANQVSAKIDSKWVMHYRRDMDPYKVNVPKDRRLSYEGRIFDITSAEMIGMKHGIRLNAMAQAG